MYTWGEDERFECYLCQKRVNKVRVMNGGTAKSLQLCVACHDKIKNHYSELSLAYKEDLRCGL